MGTHLLRGAARSSAPGSPEWRTIWRPGGFLITRAGSVPTAASALRPSRGLGKGPVPPRLPGAGVKEARPQSSSAHPGEVAPRLRRGRPARPASRAWGVRPRAAGSRSHFLRTLHGDISLHQRFLVPPPRASTPCVRTSQCVGNSGCRGHHFHQHPLSSAPAHATLTGPPRSQPPWATTPDSKPGRRSFRAHSPGLGATFPLLMSTG